MKIRNPKSRFDLKLGRNDFILDVGGGSNPYPRANIVIDKYFSDNSHRSGNLKILKNQQLIIADGTFLPIKDEIFDYVISSHALEHVENPPAFINELSRVGKKGYIETPSLIGEYLIPKKSHRWGILEIDEKIVMMEKKDIGLTPSLEFGDLFQKFVFNNSIEFSIFMRTHPDFFTVRYEWKNEIDCVINPEDEKLRSFFVSPWDDEKILTVIKRKSKFGLITSFILGFTGMIFDFIKYNTMNIFR